MSMKCANMLGPLYIFVKLPKLKL